MEPIHITPETSSFVLLADHQSRTPASFHSGPPVLHYHSKQCKLVVFEQDLVSVPALNAIRAESAPANGNVQDGDEGKEVVINGLDVWVTSDKFLLYAPAVSKGVSIAYPSISLHAIQRLQPPDSSEEVQGLYMQIASPPGAGASANRDDDEEESITMTIVPTTSEQTQQSTQDQTTEAEGEEEPPVSAIQMFYTAVSSCSNLHPDPVLPGDEEYDDGYDEDMEGDGDVAIQTGLPPPMPGSSGWITAENMHEFFDEEGNWIAGGEEPSLPLGPGAGTVRQREEDGGIVDDNAGNAGREDGQNDETKWQRTD